jgi:hypothetical protein
MGVVAEGAGADAGGGRAATSHGNAMMVEGRCG